MHRHPSSFHHPSSFNHHSIIPLSSSIIHHHHYYHHHHQRLNIARKESMKLVGVIRGHPGSLLESIQAMDGDSAK